MRKQPFTRASFWTAVLSRRSRQLRPPGGLDLRRRFFLEHLESKTLLAADLTLESTDGDISVEAGDPIVYTFDYGNAGDMDATGVVLRTNVPAHTRFDADGSSDGWDCTNADHNTSVFTSAACTLRIGDLPAGDRGSTTFAVVVRDDLSPHVTRIHNVARISGDNATGHEPNYRNNYAFETTPVVQPLHDLKLGMDDGGVSVSPGDTISYELEYVNGGNVAATGASIKAKVPAHTTFDADASSAGWTCNDAVCSVDVGDVDPGAGGSATFAVVVDADLSTHVRHITASARIADDGSGIDSNPWNNSASDRTPVVHQLPDVSLAMTDGDVEVAPGDTIRYTLFYANGGPADATGVVITQRLPAHTRFDPDGSADGWTCLTTGHAGAIGNALSAGTVCTLDVGDLAAGETGTTTLSVIVDPNLSSYVRVLYTYARITDAATHGYDANPRNNTAFEKTPVVHRLPDVSVAIDDGDVEVSPGDTFVYTVDYANEGSVDTSGVVIMQHISPLTTVDLDASTEGWECNTVHTFDPVTGGANSAGFVGNFCTFRVGDLAAGETGSAELAVTVIDPLPWHVGYITTYTLIWDDGAAGPDANPANNVAFERTRLVRDDGGDDGVRDQLFAWDRDWLSTRR